MTRLPHTEAQKRYFSGAAPKAEQSDAPMEQMSSGGAVCPKCGHDLGGDVDDPHMAEADHEADERMHDFGAALMARKGAR